MAVFSSEAAVREKFQVTDTGLVSSGLVVRSLSDAHEEILRWIDLGVNVQSPPAAVVLGETLLAGAHLLRSLASKSASGFREVRVGGNQVVTGGKAASLLTLSQEAEQAAWEALGPYLRPVSGVDVALATETRAVLGE